MEISIKDLWDLLVKRWWIVLTSAILCMVIGLGYIAATGQVTYQALSTVMFSASDDDKSTMSSSTLTASEKMIETYIKLLQSDRILRPVVEEVNQTYGTNYSISNLKNMVSIQQEGESLIFDIQVRAVQPEIAKAFANALAKQGTQIIRDDILKSGMATVVDDARDTTRQDISYLKYMMLGFFAGAVLSYGILFVLKMLDTTVKSEKDLREMDGVITIGVIPQILPAQSEKTQLSDGEKGGTK